MNRGVRKGNNLLELLVGGDDNDQIQTFDEFKEAINGYEFEKNQKMQSRNQKNFQTKMLRPRFSLNQHTFDRKPSALAYTNPTYESLELPSSLSNNLGHMGTLGNEQTGGYLNIVKEEMYSRGSTKRNMMKREQASIFRPTNQQSLIGSGSKREPFADNGSVYKSSAHSSRSFNGLDQINQYEIHEKIGSGAFSTVNLCVDVHTGQKYAMKTLTKKHFQKKLFRKNSNVLAQNYINNEIALLKKMNHAYITRLYEVIQDEQKDKMYLVLEYCMNGYINQNKKIESNGMIRSSGNLQYRRLLESECKRYFKQIGLAIDYIHNVVKIAHRDIKPQNILLNEKDQAKISDFGLGTQDITVLSKSGTRGYLPPQMRNADRNQGNFTSQMADIWALGITLLVMVQGKFVEMDDDKLIGYVSNMKEISMECKDFIKRCLQIDPHERITAQEILDHPWVMVKRSSYQEINVTVQEQQKAIVQRNKEILKEITRLHLF